MIGITYLLNIYLAVFVSFITSEPFKWQAIDSLYDLKASNLKWFVVYESYFFHYFKGNRIMTSRRIVHPRGTGLETLKYALQKMVESPNTYSYIYPERAIDSPIGRLFPESNVPYKLYMSP